MFLQIPPRLAELLRRNQSLAAGVEGSFADFSEWINNSFLPFFPDYTDHSSSHIQEVLVTASSLIRDEAWGAGAPGARRARASGRCDQREPLGVFASHVYVAGVWALAPGQWRDAHGARPRLYLDRVQHGSARRLR